MPALSQLPLALLRKCPALPEAAGWPGNLRSCNHAGEHTPNASSEKWPRARDTRSIPAFQSD